VAQAVEAIGLALAGAGVWSLVAGQIAACLAQLVVAWWFTPFRPSPRDADWQTLRALARFGRHVGAANILNLGNATADGLVIGRVLGTGPLGFYSVANRLAQTPVSILGNILGRGVYAAMAQINDDLPGVKRIWLTNLQRVALLSVPSTIGLIFTAPPLVDVVLGSEWEPAVVPLQVLTLNGLVRTFAATSGEVFQALHRAHYRVYVEVARLVLVVPALVVGARVDGIIGVAVAAVVVNVVTGLPVLAVVMRLLRASVGEVAAAVARPAIGWASMAVALAVAVPAVEGFSSAAALTTLVAVGAGLYAVAITLFARDLVQSMWLSLRGRSATG
jgi:O-antigen/teichoic acid export membrane protein